MNARQLFANLIYLGPVVINRVARSLRQIRWRVPHGWSFILGMFLGICLTLVSFVAAVAPYNPQVNVAETAPTEVRRRAWALLLQAPLRQEVVSALERMNEQELSQAYVDVHTAFEESLASSYLSAARNLIDYAFLTERELALRELARPIELPSPREMLRIFELLL
jgi:hypothetical protein